MKNVLKKVMAVTLMGIMLCGSVLCVEAAPRSTSHAHSYYDEVKVGTIRSTSTTHQYVDSHGNTQVCTVTTYLDQYNIVCSCGYVLSSYTKTTVEHSHSHS